MPHAGSLIFAPGPLGSLRKLGSGSAKMGSPSWGMPSPSFAPLLHCSYAADLYRDGTPIRNNPYDIFNIQRSSPLNGTARACELGRAPQGWGPNADVLRYKCIYAINPCPLRSESPTASVGRQVGPHPEERKAWLAPLEGTSACARPGSHTSKVPQRGRYLSAAGAGQRVMISCHKTAVRARSWYTFRRN